MNKIDEYYAIREGWSSDRTQTPDNMVDVDICGLSGTVSVSHLDKLRKIWNINAKEMFLLYTNMRLSVNM